ncbi:hypothetical protein BY996DRAFT_8493758 [Phakopsora pachyrhizi]|nr:hypothetical protein BY996DRAFT_8493758 [Phakopsora pachyrhizi]
MFAKVSLADAERRRVEVVEDRELAEKKAREAEQRVRDLEDYLEDDDGDFTKAQRETKRTISELNELRSHYNRAMNERDYIAELEMERERTMRVREEAFQLCTERDELQIRSNERMYSRGGFSNEKERLETKIVDVTKAYDEVVAAQAEQSSQIINLMSQVRDLRAARDEAESNQAALVKAKRSLKQRLKEIRSEFFLADSDFTTGTDCKIEAVRERSQSTELIKANLSEPKRISEAVQRVIESDQTGETELD